jgi:ABC-2 type transport system permease protein
MTDVRLVLVHARYALLTALRTPRTVVFGIAFPVVLLVLFDAVFTQDARPVAFAGGRLDPQAYFTAGITAYAIGLQTFTSLVVGLTTQRESGQLKRLRSTPMPPWTFVAGQALRSLVLGSAMAAALLVVAVAAFGVHVRAEHLIAFAVFVALGTLVFSVLAIAISGLSPTVDSASAAGPFIVVILSFVSGVFVAVDQLPSALTTIGKVFPLYHLADGLQTALASGSGLGLSGDDVTALVVWGLVGGWLAVRRFRWNPQTA